MQCLNILEPRYKRTLSLKCKIAYEISIVRVSLRLPCLCIARLDGRFVKGINNMSIYGFIKE